MTTGQVHSGLLSMLLSLSRRYKKILMLAADLVALPVALWSAYVMRLTDLWPEDYLAAAWWLFIVVPIVGVLIFAALGLYRAVVRFMGLQSIWIIFAGALLTAGVLWLLAIAFEITPFSRSIPPNFVLATMLYVGGSRLLMRALYHWLLRNRLDKDAVLIYGAGSAGVQLARALDGSHELHCVAFVDDDKSLWNSIVAGRRVYAPDKVSELLERFGLHAVLLAIPSATRSRRRQILEVLSSHPVHVKTIPPMTAIIAGESATELRDVDVEDLLGREPVPPMPALLDASIRHKVVMVTGAGGSIGAELCRQVLALQPRALVLFDSSEYALYAIDQELQADTLLGGQAIPVYPLLGSVCDRQRMEHALRRYGVQTLYHAAAYKHVPLVEYNILEGVRNNTLGTLVAAQAALACNLERFILISTDKAVRPTNVMGASKRLAELCLQNLAERSASTIFSMVRFGNVLGSSGSVVPLFKQQIEKGGPVTVTHPEITRYFMTISEAASLVIQAGSMAEGGDVFVLDMGEPVKIHDLAQRMVRLMGLEVKDNEHPDGDIAIRFAGLRPGEKLYEELLIGDDVIGTSHAKILRAHEKTLSTPELQAVLDELEQAIAAGNVAAVHQLLQRAVAGFQPVGEIVDLLGAADTPSLQLVK